MITLWSPAQVNPVFRRTDCACTPRPCCELDRLFRFYVASAVGRKPLQCPAPRLIEKGLAMKLFSAAFAAVIVLLATGGVVQSQAQKGGGDLTGEYELVAGWPQNWCGDGH